MYIHVWGDAFYFKMFYFNTGTSDQIVSSSNRHCSILNITDMTFTDSYHSIISVTNNTILCMHSQLLLLVQNRMICFNMQCLGRCQVIVFPSFLTFVRPVRDPSMKRCIVGTFLQCLNLANELWMLGSNITPCSDSNS